MQEWTAKVLKRAGLVLGEGACWHPDWSTFLYVDIEAQKLGKIDPVTGDNVERMLPGRVGTVVPFKNKQLLVALQDSLELYDFETGELEYLCEIEADEPRNRCNDGKCDARGRFWIGTMDIDARKGKGTLYRYDGSLKPVLKPVTISNGICWNGDNTEMYYIDSADYTVRSYDYDLETGMISNERIVIQIKEPGYLPDGMCIDEEGKLWIAMWGGGCVQRFDPATGELIGNIGLPVPLVTTCAFGGKNNSQLIILTASIGLTNEQTLEYPLSGSIFLADVGIKGGPLHHFKLPQSVKL